MRVTTVQELLKLYESPAEAARVEGSHRRLPLVWERVGGSERQIADGNGEPQSPQGGRGHPRVAGCNQVPDVESY